MALPALLAGIVLVVVTACDLAWTTLAASGGGGPVTSRLAHWMWEAIRIRRDFRGRHQLMRLGGLAVVVVTVLLWVVLLWLGWALIFSGSEAAVVSDQTGRPADWWGRVYFAGTTISTLGPGDLLPGGPAWQIATVVSSLSGLLFATLAITYLIPVVGAVTNRRQVALQIVGLGEDPYVIAATADGRAVTGDLDGELRGLSTALQRLAQQHHAYPALHYFHDVNRESAGPVQIAALDEALTLLMFGVDGHGRDLATVHSARVAVDSMLATLTSAYIVPADEPPPLPDLDRLRRLGVETVDRDTFRRRLDGLADRRRTLLGLVEDDGWFWEDVYPDRGDGDEEAPAGSVTGTPTGVD